MLISGTAGSACDPLIGDAKVLARHSVVLEGRERVTQTLTVPTPTNVAVVLHEQGLDAVVEVRSGQDLLGRADNPIWRSGAQRVLFQAQPTRVYSIDMIGKEPRGVRGQLELYLLANAGPETECTKLHRLLGVAESSYAAGQRITNDVDTAGGSSAADAYQNSVAVLTTVADTLAATGRSPLLAAIRHAVAAVLYDGVRNYPLAARWAALAAEDYAALGDDYGRARAQVVHAAAIIEVGYDPVTQSAGVTNLDRARQLLASAAMFHAARGQVYDQAVAVNYAGVAYYYDGRYQDAINAYQEALALHERAGEPLRKVQVIANLTLVEYELGRLSSAIPRFAEALGMLAPNEDPSLYINILNNSALTHYAAGNIDLALQQYDEALRLARRIQHTFYEAVSLYGLAAIYASIGESARALEEHQKALALRSVDLDAAGRADSLRAVGNALRAAGRAADAEKLHREALALARSPIRSARLRIELARDLAARGATLEADRELAAVLKQRSPGDTFVRAIALLERSEQRIASRQTAGVVVDLGQALRVFVAYGADEYQFRALLASARHAALIDQRNTALNFADRALSLAEALRERSANTEFRAQWLQRLRPAFDFKIALLTARYFDVRDEVERRRLAESILQTAERARARSLLDFARRDLRMSAGSRVLLQRRQQLYQELDARTTRLELVAEELRAGRPELRSIRSDIADLRRELDQLESQIAELPEAPTPDPRSLIRQRSALPEGAAVIEYWLGPQTAVAWIVTRDAITLHELGATSSILEAARDFTQALRSLGTTPRSERLRHADRLSELIWHPLESHLAGRGTLIFIADQDLYYVPFAALRRKSREFLVERFDVASTLSLGTLLGGSSAQRQPSRKLLLLDDPVFSVADPRVNRGSRQAAKPPQLYAKRSGMRSEPLVRLPATAQEASTIAGLLPADRVVRLSGFDATKQGVLRSNLADFAYIHFATHATADAQIPQLSSLVLTSVTQRGQSVDGRLLAADLLGVTLNADLVVLSACDTALGRQVAGEGLIGLRYATLARGARSVASSLWAVPDPVAERQMKHLYSTLFGKPSSTVHAMSSAMRALLEDGLKDPALWSAFEVTVGGMNGLLDTEGNYASPISTAR